MFRLTESDQEQPKSALCRESKGLARDAARFLRATTISTTSEVSHETRTSSASEIGSGPATRRGRSSQSGRGGRLRQFVDVRTAALPGEARRTICPAEHAVAGNSA